MKTSALIVPVLLASLCLGACDLLQPKPINEAVTFAPPPPGAGAARLYATGEGVALQSRPGDCAVAACVEFKRGKWRPMAKTSLRDLPLLAVGDATGSAYSDTLWRRIDPSSDAVLTNRQAGAFNIENGRLDGLRIGLRHGTSIGYVVAYSVETGDFLKSHGQCLAAAATPGDCAQKVGDNLYIHLPDAEVITANGKAWLLHHRADGSSTLINLFAASAQAEHHLCTPGLLLDSAPSGNYKAALSPDMFVSRAIDPSAANSDKLRCFSPARKP